MESILTKNLSPFIRDQELKIDAIRQIIAGRNSNDKNKRAKIADEAQIKTAQIRSLKYPFSTDVQFQASKSGNYTSKIVILKDNDTGQIINRIPTQGAMNLGEKALQDNIQRIIDILV